MGKKRRQANRLINAQGEPAPAGGAPAPARPPDNPGPPVEHSGPSQQGQAPVEPEPAPAPASPRALLAASLTSAWLLLLLSHAAYHVLSPQTGGWLAGLCTGLLLAAGVGAAAVGLAAVNAWHAMGLPGAPCGAVALPAALWVAAAFALACKVLTQALGALLLAPGLSLDGSLRLTSAWLVLRAMAMALLAFGPPMACLGLAAGHSAAQALLPGRPGAARLLLTALALAAARAALRGVPGTPPRPGTTIPAVVATVAALLAPGLATAVGARNGGGSDSAAPAGATGTGRGSVVTAARPSALHWAAAALVAAVAVGQAARAFPARRYSPPGLEIAEGQYHLLYASEAWLGGYVSVFEGMLAGKYRYRLLRVDHSLVGGEYMAPPEVAGQSVYTAFYLQQVILAARPINATAAPDGKPRSLHIGLGVGTAVNGLQRAGVVADVLELHREVVEAAATYFGAAALGRTLVGDAGATLRALPDGAYDYVIHDVFSGGGAPPRLMREGFFRGLRRKLVPGGVAAVNFVGSRGQPLKELWCRLHLAFPHVRAFADQEKSAVKNYVLFASGTPLAGMEARAAEMASNDAVQGTWDPPALDVLRTLGQSEVKFTFDRQRCLELLGLDDGEEDGYDDVEGGGAGGRGSSKGKGGKKKGEGKRRESKQGPQRGPGTNLPPGVRDFAAELAAAMGSGMGPGQEQVQGAVQGEAGESPAQRAQREMEHIMLQRQQQQAAAGGGGGGRRGQQPHRKKWAIERWRAAAAAGQAAAAYHWVVMRQQLDDELWRSY